MKKCKVIELFDLPWGTVAVIDFFGPTKIKIGDKLKNSENLFWQITRISRGKDNVENGKISSESIYRLDCTLLPINHTKLPLVNEDLNLIREL